MKNIQSLKSSHKNKKNKKINLQNMNEYEIFLQQVLVLV